MAKGKTKEKENTEVENKKATKKVKAKKEIEIVDKIIDEEDTEEKIETPVKKRKTYRELRKEIRNKKNDIEVEILNINSGGTSCRDRFGRILFDFNSYGEREFILLTDLYEVATKYKNFFLKHQIVIIDVDSDEYDIDDMIEFLGLNEIYDEIENYDTDYISQILKLNNREFEELINNANEDLVRSVAARAIDLFNQDKFDSSKKERTIARRLGREDLFER
ncbi:hypothetical protein [Paraclostridium sordellii]|uniref:hypothetical protein n=1 Tax=Paraclostridium sordellii TaxID=1505 RepID=UPI0022E5C7AD|nr:hypothetical protein [Paeniclostridium sordellii]